MMRRAVAASSRGGLLALAVLNLASAPLWAQTSASILGTVMDETKVGVPGVTVTVTNTGTGQVRGAHTGADGAYTITELPLGVYTVRAELAGFKTVSRAGIELTVNRRARVDLVLSLGPVTEVVSVLADAPLVEAVSNEMGTLVDNRRIERLPLNGRNTLSLVSLVPGAQGLEARSEQGFNINKVAFNGVRPELSAWLLDGGDNTSSLRNYGNPVPNPDAVQEFRVISNNYSAEYGRSAGAIVNVATKSGTNEFHGGAFEFFRHDALNADDPFLGAPPRLEQHQFGATLGGPIVKERTFFFVSYQGFRRQREANLASLIPTEATAIAAASVPTERERQGDFSQSVFQGRPVTIIDPLTGLPFPGNVIPPERISPVAARFLDLVVPVPNAPAVGPNAYIGFVPLSDPSKQLFARFDHVLSDRHRFTLSYFLNDSTEEEATSYIPYFYRDNTNTQHNVSLHEYWTPRANLLNHFRLSYARSAGSRTLRNEPSLLASDLGIDFGTLPAGPPVGPSFRVTGYFDAIAAPGGPKTSNNYTLSDSLDWIKGRHTFKFGAEVWLRRLFDHTQDDRNGGDFRFNGSVTGNSLADFLLGQVSDRFRYRATSYKSNNQWSFYGYVQDNFRVSSRLTLNLGLRYELDLYPVHPLDLLAVYTPGRESTCVPQAPTGIVFPCDPGVPRSGFDNDYDNIAPRLGFAYDVTGDGKTVVRGGYGKAYAFQILNVLQGGQTSIPFSLTAEVRNTAARNRPSTIALANPWASVAGGNPFPLDVDPASLTFPTRGSYSANRTDLPVGYYHQFNLSFQRQLGPSTVVEVAYVGNRGRDLVSSFNINQAVLSPAGTAANVDARRPLGSTPFLDLLEFEGVIPSWYDSLQARVERRFRGGFTVLGSYTFGKAIDYTSWHDSRSSWSDPRRPELDKGPADFNRKHLAVLSFLWEVPFFEDRKGALGALLGGWQINGIGTYYSGLPFTVLSGRDNNLDGVSQNDRPNAVGD
jgi:outer membrane receptor protein involved in Fe transport